MTFNYYVAASSREMDRVDRALAALDAIGGKCTYRWIDDMRRDIAAGKKESDLTKDEARAAAVKCLRGVIEADVVWLLYPTTPTRGAWGELGACAVLGIPLVVSFEPTHYKAPEKDDPGAGAQIFSRLADFETNGDEAAVARITQLAPFFGGMRSITKLLHVAAHSAEVFGGALRDALNKNPLWRIE